jgi:heme-degrading monooxygenase HmoA
MYARMVIGEAVGDDQLTAFCAIYKDEFEPEIFKEPGILTSGLMVEEAGTLAVILTTWDSRENCLRYHSSSAHRQFVSRTGHLLIGDFVVKLFRLESGK